VPLDSSLQWRAFRRVVADLRARGNDVLVLVGPFNENMVAEDNRAAYRQIHDGIVAWLKKNEVTEVAPEPLPTELYADASHPLTEGYELLARELLADKEFKNWINK
jgi:hypothetical protein